MKHLQLQMNYVGPEWQELERWLRTQKEQKIQKLLQPGTDPREVENIRGALQFIDMVLNQKKAAANSLFTE